MILRSKKIRPDSVEVSVLCSFGKPDIHKSMKELFTTAAIPLGESFAKETPMSEIDIMNWFAAHLFPTFEKKWREKLSIWATTQAKNYGYLREGTDGKLFLSEKLATKKGM